MQVSDFLEGYVLWVIVLCSNILISYSKKPSSTSILIMAFYFSIIIDIKIMIYKL